MSEPLTPTDEDALREVIGDALARDAPVEIIGAGGKAALGRHAPQAERISLAALAGISLYEPDELVLTAGAGTRLADIETVLADNNQQLAFEPPDWSALLGAEGEATIGGVIACNLSGPRRLRAGAARDHLLGVRAVSGRGEAFNRAGAWSRTSPATICASCSPARTAPSRPSPRSRSRCCRRRKNCAR